MNTIINDSSFSNDFIIVLTDEDGSSSLIRW